jgi:hypothetical protein
LRPQPRQEISRPIIEGIRPASTETIRYDVYPLHAARTKRIGGFAPQRPQRGREEVLIHLRRAREKDGRLIGVLADQQSHLGSGQCAVHGHDAQLSDGGQILSVDHPRAGRGRREHEPRGYADEAE